MRIIRDRQLAQDVIQEVFMTLYRQPDSFDPAKGSLSTWLMTVTHHKTVDAVRRQRAKTGRNTTMDLASLVADPAMRPDELAVIDDVRLRVQAALETLKPVEREVIVLAYYEGFHQSEIAELISIPLGTVKSRTLGALRRLRGSLADLAPLANEGE